MPNPDSADDWRKTGLRVVVVPDTGGSWAVLRAQGIEANIGAEADTMNKLIYELGRAIAGCFAIARQHPGRHHCMDGKGEALGSQKLAASAWAKGWDLDIPIDLVRKHWEHPDIPDVHWRLA